MQIPPLIDPCDLVLCASPKVPKQKPTESLVMRKKSGKHFQKGNNQEIFYQIPEQHSKKKKKKIQETVSVERMLKSNNDKHIM